MKLKIGVTWCGLYVILLLQVLVEVGVWRRDWRKNRCFKLRDMIGDLNVWTLNLKISYFFVFFCFLKQTIKAGCLHQLLMIFLCCTGDRMVYKVQDRKWGTGSLMECSSHFILWDANYICLPLICSLAPHRQILWNHRLAFF